MKTIIAPDNSYAALVSDLKTLAAANALHGYSRFELEGGTLRGINDAGKVVEDRYIGVEAADPLLAKIAEIDAAKKANDDAARAEAIANAPKTADVFTVLKRLTADELAALLAQLVKEGVLTDKRPAELLAL